MNQHHKLYASCILLAIVLHYLAVALTSAKIGIIVGIAYTMAVLCGAMFVFIMSGFDRG